jgi:hypothetical protein
MTRAPRKENQAWYKDWYSSALVLRVALGVGHPRKRMLVQWFWFTFGTLFRSGKIPKTARIHGKKTLVKLTTNQLTGLHLVVYKQLVN